jgi:hypothetical protein
MDVSSGKLETKPPWPEKETLIFEKNVREIDIEDNSKFRLQYLSRLSSQKIWVPPVQRPPKHQTVLIFDWDDTLLCTSFLQRSQGGNMSPAVHRVLKRIEQVALQLLETAVSLGHTFIITNAMEGWVEESARRCLPNLVPLLGNQVRVISARSTQEKHCYGDIGQWKVRAFLEVGRQLNEEAITNLVSVGDSTYELQAAKAMGSQFEKSFTKTVKLQENPTPQELSRQLELLAPKMENIVQRASNLTLKLERVGAAAP